MQGFDFTFSIFHTGNIWREKKVVRDERISNGAPVTTVLNANAMDREALKYNKTEVDGNK